MTQIRYLIKKMADFFTGEEFYEKGEDARLELSPDDVRRMNYLIQHNTMRQEPKQVELEGDGYAYGTDEIVYDFGKCPSCGWIFEDGDKDWEEPYCCHCGQKLEWFDDETGRSDKE